jgi:hypothetical protein
METHKIFFAFYIRTAGREGTRIPKTLPTNFSLKIQFLFLTSSKTKSNFFVNILKQLVMEWWV